MKLQNNNENVCPCCGKHCPSDSLSCGRGRAYFGSGNERPRQGGNIKDKTVALLLECGHTLHHGLWEKAESQDILAFLSSDEKSELNTLLQKCIAHWKTL